MYDCFRQVKSLLFCLFSVLLVTIVDAQNGAKPHEQLDEVLITATRSRFKVTSPTPMQSLSGESLQRMNSLSVADAIRHFSGVQLKDYGGVGGLKTVNVRSLGSAHTAVFYNGVQLSNAQNGQVDLGRFSMDNIEEIQLYNGQKSSIFQPARGFFASNSLYLISKRPHFDTAQKHLAKLNLKTGSFGLINPSVQWQSKIQPQLSLTANVEWSKAHGKYRYRYTNGVYDTIAERQNGDVESLRLETGLFGKTWGGTWNINAYYYQAERGLPGAIVANRYSHAQRQWDRNLFLQGLYQKSIGSNYDGMVNFKISHDYLRYLDPEYQTTEGALDNKYYQNEYYVSTVHLYRLRKWWEVSVAADYSLSSLDANLYRFPYPTRHTLQGVLSTQIRFKRFELQSSLLVNKIIENVRDYQKAKNQHLVSPVISASFQPFPEEQFRLRAFYKKAFRMPTFNDLYYTFIGNSLLRPEFTQQYNVGATWIIRPQMAWIDNLSIQSDVYYNKVKDKIVAIPSSNLFRWTMMNLGEVEIKGIETNISSDFNLCYQLQLRMGANYTYQQAIDITDDGSTYGDQIPYTPIHSGTAHASLVWKMWQLNYSFIYTGERYSQKANIPVNYVQPWYTSDMNVSYLLTSNQMGWVRSVKLGFELNNVFNQYYDVIVNFPMPGRSYRISLSLSM